jgi:hypothetical protein
MMQTAEKDPTADIRPISNLTRLFLLRNVIIVCVLAGTAVVRVVSDIQFPMWPTFCAMGLLAVVNVATWVRSKRSGPIGDCEFAGQLLADVAVLTVLLFFTGGSTNPLVSLYLLPLAIAAAVLPREVHVGDRGHYHRLLHIPHVLLCTGYTASGRRSRRF